MKFNDPFYFALPRGARAHHVREAAGNIAANFGVTGRTQLVRVEDTFALFKVTAR